MRNIKQRARLCGDLRFHVVRFCWAKKLSCYEKNNSKGNTNQISEDLTALIDAYKILGIFICRDKNHVIQLKTRNHQFIPYIQR